MKKLILLSILCLGISLGYASNNANTKPIIEGHHPTDQKSQKTEKQKRVKYDFSLFKFITPKTENAESDTLKFEKKTPKYRGLGDELSEVYEKPRCFLMFS
jgi:hypothetical protein